MQYNNNNATEIAERNTTATLLCSWSEQQKNGPWK